jgi:hypothetical protein
MRWTSLIRRFRRLSPDEKSALRAYRAQSEPILQQIRASRDAWVVALRDQEDGERLANQAAVYRWETGRLAEQFAALESPPVALEEHRQLAEAVNNVTRAYHLLANGTRFHKSDAVCEGQDLLLRSMDLVDATQRDWDERLAKSA